MGPEALRFAFNVDRLFFTAICFSKRPVQHNRRISEWSDLCSTDFDPMLSHHLRGSIGGSGSGGKTAPEWLPRTPLFVGDFDKSADQVDEVAQMREGGVLA